tara:strand:- start:11093 stop:11590 length:498 start_codon:yes stop_codon:yes gene_type:complete
MIIINKKGTLNYNNKLYKCTYGKNGFTKNKTEGDKKTPEGIFSLGKLFVRTDKIKKLKTNFHINSINKKMTWLDDPTNKNYNTLINTNGSQSEKLHRKDNLYDIILIIKYNTNPVIPYKGSAIFMHIMDNNHKPTKGCIGLKINDFMEILSTLKINDKIKILNKI